MANVDWRVERETANEGALSYGWNVPKCYMEWDIWETWGKWRIKYKHIYT